MSHVNDRGFGVRVSLRVTFALAMMAGFLSAQITVTPNPVVAGQPAGVESTGHTPGEVVTLKQYDNPNLSEHLGEPDGTYTATADANGVAEFSVVVPGDIDLMGLTTAGDPGWDDVTIVHVVAGDGR